MATRRQLIERACALEAADASDFWCHALEGIWESVDGTVVPANARYTAHRLHLEHEIHRNSRLARIERGRVLGVPVQGQAGDADTSALPAGGKLYGGRPTRPNKGDKDGGKKWCMAISGGVATV